ncbi:uncharacterized protein LOC128256234 [Drosophila gunungcola]|uniref:Protein inscuteable homologue C-terminal domain-containing protein n=1 Tax=Drosophila gunungcola TaxID=103775 RepID=A0A9Q0BMG3_9MUSC|nr:uncharacterized protein LOC128256234 [Drosophila gunungcola]KAI8036859.1 hypothetical protein M5D96_010169 [Drosophila gunungcola]
MSFQRSYSKVWWGSEQSSSLTSGGFYSSFNGGSSSSTSNFTPRQPTSLGPLGNLSCIQEVEDEQNTSKLSWHKHDSPGSLRSQDSGFSDNEESHQLQHQHQESPHSPQLDKQQTPTATPTSVHSVATPPTVVRRVGNSSFYSPLVNVTRRISFSSGQITPKAKSGDEDAVDAELEASRSRLFEQLDSMKLDDEAAAEEEQDSPPRPAIRRRRRLMRKIKPEPEEASASEEEVVTAPPPPPPYNNETVYLGEAPPPYNNETVTFGSTEQDETLQLQPSPLRVRALRFTASTSTPKSGSKIAKKSRKHPEPVASWMTEQRWAGEPEVMCTLQHKSIAQEAYKNNTITTSTVCKLVRQLQQQALSLQGHFERSERVLSGLQASSLPEALGGATQLLSHLDDFTCTLERRGVFFNDARIERRRYEQHLEQIRTVSKDTRYSLERQHYINLESLLDDVQLLKRHTLITLRLIFERLVRVLVVSIEQSRDDLLLRANINWVATLMNIDYDGFASLTDAFVQNEAVRTLLVVVLDHKQSSVRALALRALATLCCAPQAINQLGSCGGIDIVRDILQVESAGERGAIERREAVSLLAQITAAWHGPEHRVPGLRDCSESLVAGLSALLQPECCTQTLLLCAAALNNLSRMEATSHYSIMSNEAIFRLIDTLEHQSCASVFLYEQIVGMLHNMSLNKKCHSHLANGIIINFITSVYQTEFYKTYGSRAECDAQRRSIKTILHTLTRLASDSPTLGAELLEQWHLPDLLRQSLALKPSSSSPLQHLDSSYGGDISHLARQLLGVHRQEQQLLATPTPAGSFSSGHQTPEAQTQTSSSSSSKSKAKSSSSSLLKFNLTRQESFV